MMNELATIPSVLPSGTAREAASTPSTVAAPGRFSMTVATPCACAHFSATMRVNTSPPPPAGNGTMNLICREDCANAPEAEAAAARTVAAMKALHSLPINPSRTDASRDVLLEDSLPANDGHDRDHDDGACGHVDDREHVSGRGGCANAPGRAAAAGPR